MVLCRMIDTKFSYQKTGKMLRNKFKVESKIDFKNVWNRHNNYFLKNRYNTSELP